MWTIPTKFPSPQRILIRAKDRLWFSWEQKSWKGSSYHRNPRIRDLEKTQRDINTSKGKFCVGGIDKFGKADKWGRIIVRNVDGCARDVSAAVFPLWKIWWELNGCGDWFCVEAICSVRFFFICILYIAEIYLKTRNLIYLEWISRRCECITNSSCHMSIS